MNSEVTRRNNRTKNSTGGGYVVVDGKDVEILDSIESGMTPTSSSSMKAPTASANGLSSRSKRSNGTNINNNDTNNNYNGTTSSSSSSSTRKLLNRRRRVRRNRGFFSLQYRKFLVFFQQQKHLEKNFFVIAAATFLMAVFATGVIVILLHRKQLKQGEVLSPSQRNTFAFPDSSNKNPSTWRSLLSSSSSSSSKSLQPPPQQQQVFDIVFNSKYQNYKIQSHFKIPNPLIGEALDDEPYTDFGGLDIKFFEYDGMERVIYHDYEFDYTDYREPNEPRDDDVDMYYAFDDDYLRSEYIVQQKDDRQCRRISDHRLNFLNCNNLHELELIESDVKYLNEGAYRQVMKVDNRYLGNTERLILKELHYSYDIQYDHFEYVRMDAIVAERLTASPRIFDIYGLCGLSILSEYFPHGDIEVLAVPGHGHRDPKDLHDEDELKPQNELTALEKLLISKEMAEGIAVLHSYPNGVIVHDDVQLSQFLFTSDMSMVKLNDFNRAEFMLFDEGTQEYCRYCNGKGHGNWRSPEEYLDGALNEKIDVFSLGNNIYSLLTGLWPFYEERDDHKVQRQIIKGKTAFIDPRYKERSPIEKELVEVIEGCWIYNADERSSIFEVVEKLRAAVAKYATQEVMDNPMATILKKIEALSSE